MNTKLFGASIVIGSSLTGTAYGQTWTKFSYSNSTTAYQNPSVNKVVDGPGIVGINVTNILFHFSPAQLYSWCSGDNPTPGPTWVAPLTALFYLGPYTLDAYASLSDPNATAGWLEADYSIEYGSETWVYDPQTQASRECQILKSGPSWQPKFGYGNNGGGGGS